MANFYLDCKNLKCPIPIVKIGQTIKTMKTGETLEIEATDPAFKVDLEAWVNKLGHEIIEFENDEIKKAIIKKIN